jgi:hypothetical protein
MNNKFARLGFITLTAVAFTSSFLFTSASAQTADNVAIGGTTAPIYPTLHPGEVYKGKAAFWNNGDISKDYVVVIRGIRNVNGQPGTAVPLTEQEDSTDPFSASSWIKTDLTEFTLKPQGQIEINYTITVPKDVTSGGYYVGLFAIGKQDLTQQLEGTQTVTNLGAGKAIIMRVEGGKGSIEEVAKFLDFKPQYSLNENPPVTFITTIENTSNIHLIPAGKIVFRNMFGQKIKEITFNEERHTILRSATNDFETVWNDNYFISKEGWVLAGPMTAELIGFYGTQNPGFTTTTLRTGFWLIPWKVLAPILLALVLVIFFITRKLKSRRRAAQQTPVVTPQPSPAPVATPTPAVV